MNFHAYVMGAVLVAAGAGLSQAKNAEPSRAGADARPNLSGGWTIDLNISTDPARASFDQRAAGNDRQDGQQRRGGFGGRGGMGGGGFRGRGGYGGYGGGSGDNAASGDPSTPEERTRLLELTNVIKKASASLVISHNDPSLAITDALGHTQVFQTTGEKDQHQLATVGVESTTHWDGSRLVTEYTLSDRAKLVLTYTLLPNTKQLVVRINLQAGSTRRGGGSEVKLVYDLGPSTR
jgi:hypothetical protein